MQVRQSRKQSMAVHGQKKTPQRFEMATLKKTGLAQCVIPGLVHASGRGPRCGGAGRPLPNVNANENLNVI